MEFLITAASVLIIPFAIISFSRVIRREEYSELRKNHKLNLNMSNLRAGYRRALDDPLREMHIKLARIGFRHWIAIPIAYFALFTVATVLAVLGLI